MERDWFVKKTLRDMPHGMPCARAYDLAATERSQAVKNPDPTCAIKMYRSKDNYIWVTGEYHEDFVDDKFGVSGMVCKRSGDRDNLILRQAQKDGDECTIVLPVDPGAAGLGLFAQMAAALQAEGFKVKRDPTPTNKSKLTRFLPFATSAENGLVYIVEETFDKVTLDFIYKQLESFDGERSTAKKSDDFCDSFGSCYNYLSTARVILPFTVPNISSTTRLAQYKKSIK